MAKTTYKGPLQSENGFRHVAQNATTGVFDDFTTLSGNDSRRYLLETYFEHKLGINADIDQVYTVEIARGLSKHHEVLGTNMTTALCTFDTTRAGLTITTAGADEDQAIIAPHLDTDQTAWAGVLWGTENQVKWEGIISTNAIDNIKIWGGLKLTNDQLVVTDADQMFFKFQTDATNSETFTDFTLLHFVHSIGNTDYISALPITIAANTTYHLRIEVNSSRQATIFVNGVNYDVTSTAGSTGGTAVSRVSRGGTPARTAALTDDIAFIPYLGVEGGDANAAAIDVHYEAISRIIFE